MLRVISILLLCLASLASASAADSSKPYPEFHDFGYGVPSGKGGWGIFDVGVRLQPNAKEPVECTVDRLGTLSLTANVHLCLCDGKAWRSTRDDNLCQWGAK